MIAADDDVYEGYAEPFVVAAAVANDGVVFVHPMMNRTLIYFLCEKIRWKVIIWLINKYNSGDHESTYKYNKLWKLPM